MAIVDGFNSSFLSEHFSVEVTILAIVLFSGQPDLLLDPCQLCVKFVHLNPQIVEFLVPFSESHFVRVNVNQKGLVQVYA